MRTFATCLLGAVVAATATASALASCSTSSSDSGGADAGDLVLPTENACTNPSDQAATARTDYGPHGDKDMADLAADRGIACVLKGNTGSALQTCTRDGIVEDTGGAVSVGCANCYALAVTCAANQCLGDCLLDPGGVPCGLCRCGNNAAHVSCVQEYITCSGLETNYCSTLDAGADAGGDAGA